MRPLSNRTGLARLLAALGLPILVAVLFAATPSATPGRAAASRRGTRRDR